MSEQRPPHDESPSFPARTFAQWLVALPPRGPEPPAPPRRLCVYAPTRVAYEHYCATHGLHARRDATYLHRPEQLRGFDPAAVEIVEADRGMSLAMGKELARAGFTVPSMRLRQHRRGFTA